MIYQERAKRKVEKMRCIEIDDHTYDIHKLQNPRKFENQSRFKEIKIGDSFYERTPAVVHAMADKMKIELKAFGNVDFKNIICPS